MAGGERPESLLPIIMSTTSAETNNVMTGSYFAEISKQIVIFYALNSARKNYCMAIFEELQTQISEFLK